MAAMAAALRQVPPFTPLKRETTPEDAPTQLKAIDALLEARGFGETDAGVLSRVEDLLERYQARGESVQRLAGKMSALDSHRRGSEDELGAIPTSEEGPRALPSGPQAVRGRSKTSGERAIRRDARASTKLGLTPTSAA